MGWIPKVEQKRHFCHKCKNELVFEVKLQRADTCPHCGVDCTAARTASTGIRPRTTSARSTSPSTSRIARRRTSARSSRSRTACPRTRPRRSRSRRRNSTSSSRRSEPAAVARRASQPGMSTRSLSGHRRCRLHRQQPRRGARDAAGERVRVLDNLVDRPLGEPRRHRRAVADRAHRGRHPRRRTPWREPSQGVEVIFHEAALGSVPRSVEDPDRVGRGERRRHRDRPRRRAARRACGASSSPRRRRPTARRRRCPSART